jgi:hypothetical protein
MRALRSSTWELVRSRIHPPFRLSTGVGIPGVTRYRCASTVLPDSTARPRSDVNNLEPLPKPFEKRERGQRDQKWSRFPRYATYGLVGTGLYLGLSYLFRPDPSEYSPSLARQPTSTLLRSYLVWTLTSFPSIVDAAPTVLDFVFTTTIPGIRPLGEFIVRRTFFPQFIPGETAEECVPAMEEMRRRNVGHALNYSAEADVIDVGAKKGIAGGEAVDPSLARFREIERALEVQGEFERRMAEEGWARGSSAFALKTVSAPMRPAPDYTLERMLMLRLA